MISALPKPLSLYEPGHTESKLDVLYDDTSSCGDNANSKNPYLPWTTEEDEMICRVIKELHANEDGLSGGETDELNSSNRKIISWVKVSLRIPGRSPKQCRERWRNALNPAINHDYWTLEEDLHLLNAQRQIGNKWVQIAADLPGRTENGVKTRYKSIMRAKKRTWKKSEDSQLMKMYNQLGANWTEIARSLPGRSVNSIKLRYRQLLSGASNDPELGAPEQALRVFFAGYGDCPTGRLYALEPKLSPRTSRTEKFNVIEASSPPLKSEPTEIRYVTNDSQHLKENDKKRKGTRALLFDKLERERSSSVSEFSEFIAAVLNTAPSKVPNENIEKENMDKASHQLYSSPVLEFNSLFKKTKLASC